MAQTQAAQSATSRDVRSAAEKRAHGRRKVFHPAMLVTEQGSERLHLLNITTLGALGYTFTPPKKGEICRLSLLDEQVDAEIIWQEDRKFGLSFMTPISAELVARLLAVS